MCQYLTVACEYLNDALQPFFWVVFAVFLVVAFVNSGSW